MHDPFKQTPETPSIDNGAVNAAYAARAAYLIARHSEQRRQAASTDTMDDWYAAWAIAKRELHDLAEPPDAILRDLPPTTALDARQRTE